MQPSHRNATALAPHLNRCGYGDAFLAGQYNFGSGTVPLAAFADTPHDARSICIAGIDVQGDPLASVAAIRPLGAPVVFAYHTATLQWWKQTTGSPHLVESIDASYVSRFFDEHKNDFSPGNIFEGKTRRRLPGQTQLTFVDAGLMPFVERESGEALSALVEHVIRGMESTLGRHVKSDSDVDAVYKSTFWLLAAKMLREKRVERFRSIDLKDIDDVFRRVGLHYGDTDGLPPGGRPWRHAIEQAAAAIDQFPPLAHFSTDGLAHVYENAMIPPEVRKANGTHSTPGALVDYMIWQLWPWIEGLSADRRHVFEPACGHGAFLIGALRVLRQWSGIDEDRARHNYLRRHLHGIEYDTFAWEVARLRLTLADVPHGNSWDLANADMLVGSKLESEAKRCGVLLANPPYERFTKDERAKYAEARVKLGANTKVCEMLRRTIPHLAKGACFGVVVPLGFLHNKEGRELRRTLLSDFEFSEVSVFADNLFEKSDHEAAILLGRRNTQNRASATMWFRRVREPGVEAFRDRFAFSFEETVDKSRFTASPDTDLYVPELDSVWNYVGGYPMLGKPTSLGQGLFHKGQSRPANVWTIHDPPGQRDPLGYANVPQDLAIYALPKAVGINLAPEAVDREVAGLPTGKPQVLLNYAPVSRGPWRIKAVIDEEGRALTNRFIALRPATPTITVAYLWALLNSPVANAFAYCQLGKRDILVGTMRKMPLPPWSATQAAQIEQAAIRYRKLAASHGPLFESTATPEGVKQALLEMDAAVLKAYDLPPRLERQLLDLFTGVERKGVGCDFRGYYPPKLTAFVPLHELISDDYARSTLGRFRAALKPTDSVEVLAALRIAAEAYAEE